LHVQVFCMLKCCVNKHVFTCQHIQYESIQHMQRRSLCSWAVDGQNKLTNHKGKTGEYKCDQWQNGDIIGLACDLDKMQMHVSLNGSFAAPQLVV